jgi:hypothetical protein
VGEGWAMGGRGVGEGWVGKGWNEEGESQDFFGIRRDLLPM